MKQREDRMTDKAKSRAPSMRVTKDSTSPDHYWFEVFSYVGEARPVYRQRGHQRDYERLYRSVRSKYGVPAVSISYHGFSEAELGRLIGKDKAEKIHAEDTSLMVGVTEEPGEPVQDTGVSPLWKADSD